MKRLVNYKHLSLSDTIIKLSQKNKIFQLTTSLKSFVQIYYNGEIWVVKTNAYDGIDKKPVVTSFDKMEPAVDLYNKVAEVLLSIERKHKNHKS